MEFKELLIPKISPIPPPLLPFLLQQKAVAKQLLLSISILIFVNPGTIEKLYLAYYRFEKHRE